MTDELEIEEIHFVDDSEDEMFMSKLFFKRQKIKPRLVAHKSLAGLMDLVDQNAVDPARAIVFFDMNLTMQRGTEGVAALRKSLGNKVVCGIVTGSDDPADYQSAMDAGANFFVGKPLNYECIVKVCQKLDDLRLEKTENDEWKLVRSF